MPKTPKLSVAKGDKLPVSKGAGLTAKAFKQSAKTAKPAKTGALAKMKKPVKKK
jgi:hypothetical protein